MSFLFDWFWWLFGYGSKEIRYPDLPDSPPSETIKIIITVYDSQYIQYMNGDDSIQTLCDSMHKKYNFRCIPQNMNTSVKLKSLSYRLDPPEDIAEWYMSLSLTQRNGSSILHKNTGLDSTLLDED